VRPHAGTGRIVFGQKELMGVYRDDLTPASRRQKLGARSVRYIRSLDAVPELTPEERAALHDVAERFAFRTNDYYLGLIDWDDPDDPIRRLVIPHRDELHDWGALDASNEASNTRLPGLQHKYGDTALLLAIDACGGYCRYCFRKRLFMHENAEVSRDIGPGLEYIRAHPEISNVLVTGGDPLLLSTARIERLLGELADIPHVRMIRLGTKMLAFNPYRVLEDERLQHVIERFSGPGQRIYFMLHFDHPREITHPAREAIRLLRSLGAVCVNQCPIIAGVNDDPIVLAELFQLCTNVGCPQYYVFQGRPTAGNEPYEVPIVRGWTVFSHARRGLSGLSRRARFVMSHATGKIEIVGVDDERIYLRYHRAKDPADEDRVIVCRRDDDAYWLDQLEPIERA